MEVNHKQIWKKTTLGKYFQIKHGYAFKGEFFADAGPYILLTPGNFKMEGGIVLKGEREKYYTGKFPKEFLLKQRDFLVVMTDLTQNAPILGSSAIIREDNRFLHNQRLGKVVGLKENELHSLFLYYLFNSPNVRDQIKATATGATVKHTAPDRIYAVKVDLPPLPIQRTIASILSAYDDLIENNMRRIAILEEMAQMIYEEWFVKFRFPGYEQMGTIPGKWEMVPVSSAVYINPTTHVPKEGEKAFVPMTSLSNNSMLIDNVELRDGNSGSKFKNNDTLFARITPCIENGKTGYVQFLPDAASVAFGSTEFIVLRSKTLSPKYVYLMARTNAFRDHAIKSMSGASGRQRIQMACFDTFFVAQPDQYTILGFEKLVSPIFRDIHILSLTNAKLRRTCDLLLPKLISGEIDVSSWVEGDAQEIAQELAASAVGTTNGYDPRIDTIRRVAEAGPIEPMEKDALEWHSLWE
jgi:type I restriction enzyme, S subunit